MPLVDWGRVLAGFDVKVPYSNLDPDEVRDVFDDFAAEIEFPGEYFIDVSWRHDNGEYVVRLYRHFFAKAIVERSCKTVPEVIDAVRRLAELTMVDNTFTDLSHASESDREHASAGNSFVSMRRPA